MQIRSKKDPTKSLTYATREEDMKFFNVGENEEEVNSTLTKKQKTSLCTLCIDLRLDGLEFHSMG